MVAAEIPQDTVFMMSGALKFMIQSWPTIGLGGKVSKYFSLFEGDFCRMYYLRTEFDAQAAFLADKMISDPDWALGFIKKVENWSANFFKESKRFRKLNFSQLDNQQMIREYQKPLKYHVLSHGNGSSVSWHADADKQKVTKAMLKTLQCTPEQFSTLSTPYRGSLVRDEEKDILRLAIIKDKQKLIAHAKKYEWLNYQYKGPAYDFSYFDERFKALLKGKNDFAPDKLLEKILQAEKALIPKQQKLITSLKFSRHQVKLIRLAQALVFIKDYRKDALYHGMYSYEPFFREVGRRLGLSLDQVRAFNYWEVGPALLKGAFDPNELNQRLKFCVAWVDKKNYIVYTGEKAREILSKISFEKLKTRGIEELIGMCACPGVVKGIVKIVNIPEDMEKMETGNVLVAHNTNPNLVPAMKMAAAIISEAGGLTCHSAIVAREFQIPCVVGVPGADKILRDGDLVKVDATKGIIKKLK